MPLLMGSSNISTQEKELARRESERTCSDRDLLVRCAGGAGGLVHGRRRLGSSPGMKTASRSPKFI